MLRDKEGVYDDRYGYEYENQLDYTKKLKLEERNKNMRYQYPLLIYKKLKDIDAETFILETKLQDGGCLFYDKNVSYAEDTIFSELKKLS